MKISWTKIINNASLSLLFVLSFLICVSCVFMFLFYLSIVLYTMSPLDWNKDDDDDDDDTMSLLTLSHSILDIQRILLDDEILILWIFCATFIVSCVIKHCDASFLGLLCDRHFVRKFHINLRCLAWRFSYIVNGLHTSIHFNEPNR